MARSVQATAGVAAVVDDRILLVRRTDDGTWCLPGGRVEFGESITACAQREFEEETGQTVELTGLLGVYSRPDDQVHQYPDGEIVHFVGVVFEGRAGGGAGALAGDTSEARWFAAAELPAELMASDAPPIHDALARRAGPVID